MAKDKPEFTAKMLRLRKGNGVDGRADELVKLMETAVTSGLEKEGLVRATRAKTGYDVQYGLDCLIGKSGMSISAEFAVTSFASGKNLATAAHKLDVPIGGKAGSKTDWPDIYIKDFRKSAALKKLAAAALKDVEAQGEGAKS